jgi:hypothetical protein
VGLGSLPLGCSKMTASAVMTTAVSDRHPEREGQCGDGQMRCAAASVCPAAQVAAATSAKATPTGLPVRPVSSCHSSRATPRRCTHAQPAPARQHRRKHQRADHGREDRHGVAQDGRAPAGQRIDRQDDAHVPDKHVGGRQPQQPASQCWRGTLNGTFSTTSPAPAPACPAR